MLSVSIILGIAVLIPCVGLLSPSQWVFGSLSPVSVPKAIRESHSPSYFHNYCNSVSVSDLRSATQSMVLTDNICPQADHSSPESGVWPLTPSTKMGIWFSFLYSAWKSCPHVPFSIIIGDFPPPLGRNRAPVSVPSIMVEFDHPICSQSWVHFMFLIICLCHHFNHRPCSCPCLYPKRHNRDLDFYL